MFANVYIGSERGQERNTNVRYTSDMQSCLELTPNDSLIYKLVPVKELHLVYVGSKDPSLKC